MKTFLICISLLFLLQNSSYAQLPPNSPHLRKTPGDQSAFKTINPSRRQAEDCSNNVDDDGNGLIDMNDFSCYFSNTSPDTCISSKIMWATFSSRLYWVDLETNQDRVFNFPPGEVYDDITWASNGKLYGAERFTGQIREIDPNTAQTQFVHDVPGHYYTNGMTADASGNLYLTSYSIATKWNIVKLNIATGQASIIVSLTARNLESAGDLCFLDGFLYVSCSNDKLAKIDIGNGNLQILNITGPSNGLGLMTLGDGYLYISDGIQFSRLDLTSMVATPYYTMPTYGFIHGLANYGDLCEAPSCRARLRIENLSTDPNCSNTGVLLKAVGTGINGASAYTWTLPGGQTMNNDTITVFTSGRYYLRYHTLPDSCGVMDSIDINITRFPLATLGKDTILCTGSSILLQPLNTQDVVSYLWQDGSSASQLLVTTPGSYWLQTSNSCGTFKDTILISSGTMPQVNLEKDTLICPGSPIVLKNHLPKIPGDNYLWSNSQTTDIINVNQPGIYWLQTSNTCGVARDTIILYAQDSCVCNPFYPLANLGNNREICPGESITLANLDHKNGFKYTWQNSTTGNNFLANKPGIYWLEVSTYCGTLRDSVIVTQKTTADCSCDIYLPNAFTPNRDGKNDEFKPFGSCLFTGEMRIFNRYGQMVYFSTNLQKGWDGTYKGKPQPQGAYVCYVKYKYNYKPVLYDIRSSFILLR